MLFPLCLARSITIFCFTKGKKHKAKATEWHNKLKLNKLKINLCQLTLYLNYFNENKLMFGRHFLLFYFFCGIVKLICELRHAFFINLRLQQILNIRSSALFCKNLRSAAGKLLIVMSAAKPTPPPPSPSYNNNFEFWLISILVDFAYFFTLSFFLKKNLWITASIILMTALLTKHSIVPAIEKTGVCFRNKFR